MLGRGEKKTLDVVLRTRGKEDDEESWMCSVSILMCEIAYCTIHWKTGTVPLRTSQSLCVVLLVCVYKCDRKPSHANVSSAASDEPVLTVQERWKPLILKKKGCVYSSIKYLIYQIRTQTVTNLQCW